MSSGDAVTVEEALRIIEESDGYISYRMDNLVTLDGNFTTTQLEAIVLLLKSAPDLLET